MSLPLELLEEPAETTVVGDIEAFIAYVESGQALQDWNARLTARRQELEELF
jgi:hypothetical protein